MSTIFWFASIALSKMASPVWNNPSCCLAKLENELASVCASDGITDRLHDLGLIGGRNARHLQARQEPCLLFVRQGLHILKFVHQVGCFHKLAEETLSPLVDQKII